MTKTMQLAIYNRGGGYLEKELQYQGSTEEIAAQIERDENALLEYMTTGDDRGQKSFVFAGFMFRKDMIEAAQMTEPDF